MDFNSFSFHPSVNDGIAKAGFKKPTPIQVKAVPEIISGKDVMGLAQTGTGKTAAFVLPLLNRLMNGRRGTLRALIIAPTRELAEQIHVVIKQLGRKTKLKSLAVYGGVSIVPQIKALKRTDIVVGCPGRLLDHIRRKTMEMSRLEVLVLDEADQMFDMGFLPDIRKIISHTPEKDRQTLMFSATMPGDIQALADEILSKPFKIDLGAGKPSRTISHSLYPVSSRLKKALLFRLLSDASKGSVLVFTRTKSQAKSLDETLFKAGYSSTSIQGNLSQGKRRAALDRFRSGKSRILVATDIAARGIDISNITHVINYDFPATSEDYIHRVGRTGRADKSGGAYTIVTREDRRRVSIISKAAGKYVDEVYLEGFDYDDPRSSLEKKNHKKGGSPFKSQSRSYQKVNREKISSSAYDRTDFENPRRSKKKNAKHNKSDYIADMEPHENNKKNASKHRKTSGANASSKKRNGSRSKKGVFSHFSPVKNRKQHKSPVHAL
jgi:ATP-dependent RNA helicase RhlE